MRRELIGFLIFTCPLALFASDTDLRYYRPFTETVRHPEPQIEVTKAGFCTQQSERIKREDAWRCVAEDKIYDPCFVNRNGSHKLVVCPKSPWLGKSVQISLKSPLDNQNHLELDMSRTFPWAVELATGEKCKAVDPNELYDNLPIRYRCSKTDVLIGHIQRCAANWKMLEKTAAGVTTVEIARAWF